MMGGDKSDNFKCYCSRAAKTAFHVNGNNKLEKSWRQTLIVVLDKKHEGSVGILYESQTELNRVNYWQFC